MSEYPPESPAPGQQEPGKWKPSRLPTTGVHTATFSLPVPLLKQIEAEVSDAREAGYNRTKSGLVAEALEMYFKRHP